MSLMSSIWKLTRFAAPAAFLMTAFAAAAAPVQVGISSFAWTPGSGYGTDASEGSGTLLGATFANTFVAQNLVLNGAGAFATFNVATVTLTEPNSNGGINANETDNLGLSATLTFTSPFGSLVGVTASGTATTGSVSDSFVDLTIMWQAVQIAFGNGGLLNVALDTLAFSAQGSLTQTATVTLLRAEQVAEPAEVPEPSGLLLAGVALAGLGLARRRKR